MGYPLVLSLSNATALVVGAGGVAARRIRGLLDQGARVRVVAPNLNDEVKMLAQAEEIELRARKFVEGDLDGVILVHAATSDRATNHAIAVAARSRGLLVCCADNPDDGNFVTPSAFSRGELTVAISTQGASPTLASVLRERLEAAIGPEFDLWTALFARLRPVLKEMSDGVARRTFVARVLDDPQVRQEILRRDILAAETAARRCI